MSNLTCDHCGAPDASRKYYGDETALCYICQGVNDILYNSSADAKYYVNQKDRPTLERALLHLQKFPLSGYRVKVKAIEVRLRKLAKEGK